MEQLGKVSGELIQIDIPSGTTSDNLFASLIEDQLENLSAASQELVQFCGRTASQGLVHGCYLVPAPNAKLAVILVAMGSNLYLNLGIGLFRHLKAYGAKQAGSEVKALAMPQATPA